MDSLYQRLKEMDADTFQRFCFQLLEERHPGQGLRHIEGAAGDQGLDVFAGELSGKPVIGNARASRTEWANPRRNRSENPSELL